MDAAALPRTWQFLFFFFIHRTSSLHHGRGKHYSTVTRVILRIHIDVRFLCSAQSIRRTQNTCKSNQSRVYRMYLGKDQERVCVCVHTRARVCWSTVIFWKQTNSQRRVVRKKYDAKSVVKNECASGLRGWKSFADFKDSTRCRTRVHIICTYTHVARLIA